MESLPPHHTPKGFRNIWPENRQYRRRDVIDWILLRRKSDQLRFSDHVNSLPVAEPELDIICQPPEGITVTWLGHAACLIQAGGLNILTDPIFSERCSPVQFAGPRRLNQPPMAPEQLPAIDYVLISHDHYDHLDLSTARLLGNSVKWLVPLGIKRWLIKRGISNVVELDWWKESDLEHTGKAVCLPARHFSSRIPWNRNRTLWASWLLEVEGKQVYFAGDTGYEQHFQQIGKKFGPPDLAILPIGAYRPEWFMLSMHLNPEQAVRAHLDLGARRSLGVHWSTFILSDESPDEPPRLFLESARQNGLQDNEVFVLRPGETRVLS
jgi:N-acyl-phosphatidylethanolamine-hydrolysing phospholipase D